MGCLLGRVRAGEEGLRCLLDDDDDDDDDDEDDGGGDVCEGHLSLQ